MPSATQIFQSTLSVRRATRKRVTLLEGLDISIHALRKESDGLHRAGVLECGHISIHALRKESDVQAIHLRAVHAISIHALRKESDPPLRRHPVAMEISIHALRKESDRRVRPVRGHMGISIHALRKESDRAAGHFCPLSETQASCLALSISNNTTGTTNNMPKTSSDNVRIPAHFRFCSSLRC